MGNKFDSFLGSAGWNNRFRNDTFDIFGKASGMILAGGSFHTPYEHITNWSGTAWGNAGDFNNEVAAIFYHSGFKKVFISGSFTDINGAAISYVTATAQGQAYEDLSATTTPQRFIYDSATAIIGAHIADPGIIPKRYSGGVWADLPTSNWRYGGGIHSPCTDFLKHGNYYIACGEDPSFLGLAVAWGNSSGWSYISPYTDDIWSAAHAISFNGDLYAVFSTYSGSGYGFRKWLGTFNHRLTDWSALIDNIPMGRMFVFDNKILGFKASSPYLVYSDGTSAWATYAGGVNNTISDMCIINGELYVVGSFTQVGGSVAATRAAIYNTVSGWRAMSTGLGATPLAIGGFI